MPQLPNWLTALVLSLCGLTILLSPALARPKSAKPVAASSGELLKRDVLGLYDGKTEPVAKRTRLHRHLEMPLNHLGYRLTLHDVSNGLPADADLKRYHAVATWFSGEISGAHQYLAWAASRARKGTRFVVLDSVGLLGSKTEIPLINAFLGELGVGYAEYYVSDTKSTRIEEAGTMIGFEAKLDPGALPGHQVVVVKDPRTVTHLSVTDPAHRWVAAPNSALVTTHPRGGFASSGYAVRYDTERKITQWVIDPFAFLEYALGGERRPIPDTTTMSGRRIYFSHIDGDGWNNTTSVEPHASNREPAAAAMLDKLIAPYPDLPVSVGLIAGDTDPMHGGVAQAAGIARKMFALPQVETASHTCTHPYHWAFYETYKREAEISRVLQFADAQPAYDDRSLASLVRHWRTQAQPQNAVSNETVASLRHGLPRARPQQPFNLDVEVKEALVRASQLAPREKPARLYLWSGDTTPFEAAIRATREAGARNMNGGDSRLDATYPSVTYVPPIGIAVGAERQIYAVNSNENTYTNGWTGPFDAFKQLSETLDNTERPRRLKAFNLYYHSYSASRPDALDAVRIHLDRARNDAVTPIKASHYAAIAEGFYSTEIVMLGRDRWRILNRGSLDAVRFDNVDPNIGIDVAASQGVIGYTHHQGSVYVSLDRSVTDPMIVLQSSSARGSRPIPHLIESRWTVSALERKPCRTAAVVQGYGRGDFTWGGFNVGSYAVRASRNGSIAHSETVAAAGDGTLKFALPAIGIEPLAIDIACSSSIAEAAAMRVIASAPQTARKSLRAARSPTKR